MDFDTAQRLITHVLGSHWPAPAYTGYPCRCGEKYVTASSLRTHITNNIALHLQEHGDDVPLPLQDAADTVRRNREESRTGPFSDTFEKWLRDGAPLGKLLDDTEMRLP